MICARTALLFLLAEGIVGIDIDGGNKTTPLTPAAAVALFNKQYMDYNFVTFSGMLGVTISWAAQQWNFTKNLFCRPMLGTGCYNGESDCRMSASLFNWKMCNQNYIWSSTFGR